MKRDTLICIITAILTVGFSVAALIAGMNSHSRAIAKKQVNSMTQSIAAENERLKSRQEILSSGIGSKTDSSGEKNELNGKITKLKEDIQKADSDIKEKTDTLNSLKTKADDIKKITDRLKSGVDLKRGRTETFSDTVVLAGDELKPGRYLATGDGSFSVSSILSGTRISEELLLLNSYTFDLEEGDRISVHGTVSFTVLE